MRLFLYVLALLFAVTVAASARPVLRITDIARIVNLDEPAISPDGRLVALVEVAQDLTHARYVSSLVLVSTGTGRTRTLVRGHDVAVPRWSPDGRALGYVARAGSAAIRQLFVRRDGATRELTHARGDVIDFAWSANGRQIAYVAADPPAGGTYFLAGDNDYTAAALTPPDHLWIVASSGGVERRLTRGEWTIAPTDPGGIFSPQIAWAPGGRAITLTRLENTFSGDSERSTLWNVDAVTGAIHKLTSRPEFELTPAYSPDGGALTYWYPLDGDFNSENTLRLTASGKDIDLAASLDRNIAGARWFPDGRRLLICAADHTQMTAWILARNGSAQPLRLGDLHMVCDPYSSSTFDSGIDADIASDGAIAFVATSATRARELYFLARGATVPQRLTHANDFLDNYTVGRMEELDWTGPDGFAENGVVTYPPGDAPNGAHKFPIVLLIHGGPGLSSTRDFAWEQWPLAQTIASRGYVVLQPNYRGSDNMGNAYMIAIVRNTVAGPASDIMAGLAQLERRMDIDPSRVAVSGWSYGGELTSWLIGHEHRWRAAVSGAAVNSEFDEYNLSTSNVQDRYPLGTSPFTDDGQRIYRDNSPITYYAAITTPTLIWGTTLDPVVPITQSYALYHALHDNGVPVQFAVFPAATHGPGDPRQTVALTRLWLDWLDRYLR